jgi:hypothetical protein
VFARSTDDTTTYAANYPSPGYHVPSGVSIATGGNATLDMHSNGTVYGSVVLQGTSGHINGTSAVVYNQDVLTALQNSGSFVKFGGVPGGWTDRTSY